MTASTPDPNAGHGSAASHVSAASAERRGTGDPNVFLIPDAALPAGFAERVASGDYAPVEARPAATVVLVRDGEQGPEVLLLRRHRRSGFAAGAWVFPGGVVDAEDQSPAALARLAGPSPAEWAARLGLEDAGEAAGYVVAALREAFEETGILLARGAPALASEALEDARQALLEAGEGMGQVAERLGIELDGGVAYVAHWITPEPEPRRYDTRFFLARVPAGAECVPHAPELVDAAWLPPAEALRRFERGEMK
ncbi:MAG TPA: NUDIX domain-containing protein, partial [Longimicrobium sp.]|nr:NUDIX domain-containing protein [Longimicrobium sp.]